MYLSKTANRIHRCVIRIYIGFYIIIPIVLCASPSPSSITGDKEPSPSIFTTNSLPTSSSPASLSSLPSSSSSSSTSFVQTTQSASHKWTSSVSSPASHQDFQTSASSLESDQSSSSSSPPATSPSSSSTESNVSTERRMQKTSTKSSPPSHQKTTSQSISQKPSKTSTILPKTSSRPTLKTTSTTPRTTVKTSTTTTTTTTSTTKPPTTTTSTTTTPTTTTTTTPTTTPTPTTTTPTTTHPTTTTTPTTTTKSTTTTTPTTTTTTTTTPLPTSPSTPKQRYCAKGITTSRAYTKCAPCRAVKDCPDGYHPATTILEKCKYKRGRRMKRGCNKECKEVVHSYGCCHGYWGTSCDACPGGSNNPCSGRGKCADRDGTCTCQDGFTGKACERCQENNRYGPDCKDVCICLWGFCNKGPAGDGTCTCMSGYRGMHCDERISECDRLACNETKNLMCVDVHGTVDCVCSLGYRPVKPNAASSTELQKADTPCVEINPCQEDSEVCPSRSFCVYKGPGEHICECVEGFEWDVGRCIPINPCRRKNGGCVGVNEQCVNQKPVRVSEQNWLQLLHLYHLTLNDGSSTSDLVPYLKHVICQCKKGYTRSDSKTNNCTFTDVCTTHSCDPNAVCQTLKPLTITCTCKEGYTGDGKTCYGNLLETVTQLNTKHPLLRKTLDQARKWLVSVMNDPLISGGPFTLFLPNDKSINNALKRNNWKWKDFLSDKDWSSQVLRQHILIGKYKIRDLVNYDKFYTLQGNSAEMQVRLARNTFKFKLHGSGSKPPFDRAKLLSRDFEATNGIIHVINNMMTLEPEVKGDPKKNAFQLIQHEESYNRFQTMIRTTGLNELFQRPSITVFAPENGAWDRLPEGTIEYLTDNEVGKTKLKTILENHVFEGHHDVHTMIQSLNMTSVVGTRAAITITELGRIQIGSGVNVTQVNIPCKDGFYHHVSSLLVPEFLRPILPNTCYHDESIPIKGRCGACPSKQKCVLEKDEYLKDDNCLFWGQTYKDTPDMMKSMAGCQTICTRKIRVPGCCPGYYASDCRPCPGGFANSCNGHGKCDDGRAGKGTCKCDEGYSGAACERCEQHNMYGPACDQVCKCLMGVCDDGPKGSGGCKTGTCYRGYHGEMCDRTSKSCGFLIAQYFFDCHANSHCRLDADGIPRCMCNHGYRKNGRDCDVVNLCEEDNGGCHAQAECELLKPGYTRCSCREGWRGDGFYCTPKLQCLNHSDCDSTHRCVEMEIGKTQCVKRDPCLEDNGGCVARATCLPDIENNPECTCAEGFEGNGTINCYGTIYDETAAHPRLTILTALIRRLSIHNIILNSRSDVITFLAPSDDAMKVFLQNSKTRVDIDYWDVDENLFNFVNFHMIFNDYTMADFLSEDETPIHKYETYYDGFSVHIANINQSLHLFVNHSDFAQFLDTDIKAINGHVHIVDKVLEPFYPDNNPPDLEDAMTARKELTLFKDILTKYDYFKSLDSVNEFTVFAPTNQALGSHSMAISTDLIEYTIPTIILTPSIMNGDKDDNGFQYTVKGDQIFVNGVAIVESDILVEGGVMHVIDGLLHDIPIFKRCQLPDVAECCVDFFGPDCKECPSCGERGVCRDGMDGDGTCECLPRFAGPECQDCQFKNASGPHCETAINFCAHNNGNCSIMAKCENRPTGVECICPERLVHVLAERECVTHCKLLHGQECHENAKCVHEQGTSSESSFLATYSCICLDNYRGNGTVCKEDINLCSRNNGGCDVDRANCSAVPPEPTSFDDGRVACTCMDGFVGDGTLCSTDMLDALERIPELDYFYKYTMNQHDNSSILLTDSMATLNHSLTLFAPVSKNWSNLNLTNMVVVDEAIVLPNNGLEASTSKFTWVSVAGGNITVTTKDDKFFVNGVNVVRKNIQTLNGILHLTQDPVPKNFETNVGASTHSSSSSSITIVASVLGVVVVVVLVVLAAVFIKRARDRGSFGFFKSHSESNVSFARLQAKDNDSDSFRGSDSAKYDNPVFDDLDDLQILS